MLVKLELCFDLPTSIGIRPKHLYWALKKSRQSFWLCHPKREFFGLEPTFCLKIGFQTRFLACFFTFRDVSLTADGGCLSGA